MGAVGGDYGMGLWVSRTKNREGKNKEQEEGTSDRRHAASRRVMPRHDALCSVTPHYAVLRKPLRGNQHLRGNGVRLQGVMEFPQFLLIRPPIGVHFGEQVIKRRLVMLVFQVA